MEKIINKVTSGSLVSIDMDDWINFKSIVVFDFKDFLYQGLILKERDFRLSLREINWTDYQAKPVFLTCSADAIIPVWAYMVVTSKLIGIASDVDQGSQIELEKFVVDIGLSKINWTDYQDAKVVIKGCGALKARDYAFTKITKYLTPYVSRLMYGEPCSTVPVYKKPIKR